MSMRDHLYAWGPFSWDRSFVLLCPVCLWFCNLLEPALGLLAFLGRETGSSLQQQRAVPCHAVHMVSCCLEVQTYTVRPNVKHWCSAVATHQTAWQVQHSTDVLAAVHGVVQTAPKPCQLHGSWGVRVNVTHDWAAILLAVE